MVDQYFGPNTSVFIMAAHECNNSVVTLCCSSAYTCIGSWPCNNSVVTLMGGHFEGNQRNIQFVPLVVALKYG